MNKITIITGIEGQDPSYLADALLAKTTKNIVVGVTRRSGTCLLNENLDLAKDHPNFKIEYGDITDESFISDLLQRWQPDYYYNLAAMSHVGQSFKEPIKTFETNATAVIQVLESIRHNSPKTKFLQASTSEMMGGFNCPIEGFNEESRFNPRSPYAIAKVAAFHAVKNYREAYGLFATNAIMFNHSSTRRGFDFATRKICRGLAEVKVGKKKTLKMGDLSTFRDESHASDMIRGMQMIINHHAPDDFVLASGTGATIENMFRYVCELANLDFQEVYELDQQFCRPSDVPYLIGNAKKANTILGWKPQFTWKDLLKEMYEYEYQSLRNK